MAIEMIEADIEELEEVSRPHRGRISFPILKQFMESGLYCIWIKNPKSINTKVSVGSLRNTLSNYARKHGIPVTAKVHNGKIYLVRLDILKDGSPDPKWKGFEEEPEGPKEVVPLSIEIIKKRVKGDYSVPQSTTDSSG